jgi:hypothetical protein
MGVPLLQIISVERFEKREREEADNHKIMCFIDAHKNKNRCAIFCLTEMKYFVKVN